MRRRTTDSHRALVFLLIDDPIVSILAVILSANATNDIEEGF
jgi:hypothetical protein